MLDDTVIRVGVVIDEAVLVYPYVLLRDVLHRLGCDIDDILARDEDQLRGRCICVFPTANARALGEDLVNANVGRRLVSSDELPAIERKGEFHRVRYEVGAMVRAGVMESVPANGGDVLAEK